MGEEPGGGREGGGGEETQGECGGGRVSQTEGVDTHEERKEKKCKQKVLGLLRQLSVHYADGVTAWREVVRGCADMINPPGGSDLQHPPAAGEKPFKINANTAETTASESVKTVKQRRLRDFEFMLVISEEIVTE